MTRGILEQNWRQNYHALIGIDEVGKGCIAGPVFAAAVQLDYEAIENLGSKETAILRDSKTLSTAQRQRALSVIDRVAVRRCIAHATVSEIELLGIQKATFLAMTRSLQKWTSTKASKSLVIVDGRIPVPKLEMQQECIVGGDNLCYAVACASIAAKEARDTLMRAEVHSRYPEYGFDRHVGYGTRFHLDALEEHGYCEYHRRNFAPIRSMAMMAGSNTSKVSKSVEV